MLRKNTKKNQSNRKKKPKDGIHTKYGLAGSSLILLNEPIPDGVFVRLKWTDNVTLTKNNAGFTYLSWRYRMNSAYDPDPVLGSGSISYFLEWAAMYRLYRVMRFHYDITISNLETFPVNVTACPSTIDLGLNTSNATEFSEVPYGRSASLSAKTGNDRTRITGMIDLKDYYGTNSYLFDNNLGSLTTTNPAVTLYYNVGAFAPTGFLNGIVQHVNLWYDVYFYDKTFQIS